jgi:hypothetical protein
MAMVLDVALKEWAVVWELVLEGRFALLLRKGGIHEVDGPGCFEPEHERFALWPSWEHQKPEGIKPALRERVRVLEEPDRVPLRGWAEVQRIWRVPSREAFDRLDALHPWSEAQIDMRFRYKPERPLYLVAVRADPFPGPRAVDNHPDYQGCRSWVPLRQEDRIEAQRDSPAMSEAAFERVVAEADAALGKQQA